MVYIPYIRHCIAQYMYVSLQALEQGRLVLLELSENAATFPLPVPRSSNVAVMSVLTTGQTWLTKFVFRRDGTNQTLGNITMI